MNKVVSTKMFMRLKVANNAFLSYDLMNVFLLAASAVMRLKLYKFIKLPLWYLFAEIRAEEKEKSTHHSLRKSRNTQCSSSRRKMRRREKRRKKEVEASFKSSVLCV
jgi:hypothetical protein